MFESELSLIDSESTEVKHLPKRRMLVEEDDRIIHSSLTYSSLTAPPLVEYKSIEGYCERNIITSDCPPATSNINNLQNISSPIVFKCQKPIEKRTLPPGTPKPHLFFSIEELSLVKCLKNWKNTNVCPIGIVSMDYSTQDCYLNSVMENGNWHLLLDTSLLTKIPDFQKLLQAYGTLEVYDEIPRLKIKFCRSLECVDLPRFIESYKLMQKYIPVIEDSPRQSREEELNDEDTTIAGAELNDTLDDYNFSLIV